MTLLARLPLVLEPAKGLSIVYWGRQGANLLFRIHCEWLCGVAFVACGGSVQADDDARGDAGPSRDGGQRDSFVDSRGGSGGRGGSSGASGAGRGGSGLGGAIDPSCPDASPPEPRYDCNPVAPAPGGCPVGQACYFHTEYGGSPCAPNSVVARCENEGTGTQGTPCGVENQCAGDFICVGLPFQCSRRCRPGEPCKDGLICEGVVGIPSVGTCR